MLYTYACQETLVCNIHKEVIEMTLRNYKIGKNEEKNYLHINIQYIYK